jgi:diguanylate cyclase (GGDEF)-like protein
MNHHGSSSASQPRSLKLYVAAVTCGAAAIIFATFLHASRSVFIGAKPAAVVIFAVLLVVGEARPLKWLRLNDGGELTASWSFALAILLLDAPAGAILMMAVASVVGDSIHRKPLMRTVFNASQITLALAVAVNLLTLFGQDDELSSGAPLDLTWFAVAFIAATALFVVNATLTCIALALHEGTSINRMMRRGLHLNISTDGALVALSPIFAVVAQRSLLLLPLIVATAGFVYRSTRSALDNEHEANHDELTTLLNRRAFMARLADELSEREPTRCCALVLIDLDEFKQINDRLGHSVGDSVLRELGIRLGGRQRQGEIAARIGGDEFALLMTNVASPTAASARAEQLLALIREPLASVGFPLGIAASVGVSAWPDDGADAATLIQAADLAMYAAKRAGNSVQVSRSGGGPSEVGRLTLLAELQAGLARGELTLWYQPQLDLVTGRIIGFEALIRWNHPKLGIVTPDHFMALAEHTDLMAPLTEFVVRTAARDLVQWLPVDSELQVAVNVSAQNLHDLEFPKFVARILAETDLPSRALEIEITENAVLAHPDRARAVLQTLSQAGVRITIDDFGTGFSSLANLRQLPVQEIKIDRSFVRDMARDPDDHTVVRAVVDLAHRLGLTTVAEGVETQECLDQLREIGCDAAQGFLIARPMPARDVERWLLEHKSFSEPARTAVAMVVPA